MVTLTECVVSQCTGDMDSMSGVFGNAGLIIHPVTDIVVVKLLSTRSQLLNNILMALMII